MACNPLNTFPSLSECWPTLCRVATHHGCNIHTDIGKPDVGASSGPAPTGTGLPRSESRFVQPYGTAHVLGVDSMQGIRISLSPTQLQGRQHRSCNMVLQCHADYFSIGSGRGKSVLTVCLVVIFGIPVLFLFVLSKREHPYVCKRLSGALK